MESRYIWKKATIQDRPTFSLGHRIVTRSVDGYLVFYREFYVSQSYNSLQTGVAVFPIGDQTLVVYVNRTSTDQVAGFGSSMKHGIGRKMMVREMRKNFDELKAASAR
jgi:hypothetical protein